MAEPTILKVKENTSKGAGDVEFAGATAAEGGGRAYHERVGVGETEVKEDEPLLMKRRKAALIGCCGVLAFTTVLLGLIILILAFTVFKAKEPDISIKQIELGSLGLPTSLNLSDLHLNLSLTVVVSVYNPNHASFRYSNSTSFMFYRQLIVGEASVPAGKIGARDTEVLRSTLMLNASSSLLLEPNLLTDFSAGSFPMSTSSIVYGRVNILNIFKHHARSSSVCTMSIDISSRSVQNLTCSTHVKFL